MKMKRKKIIFLNILQLIDVATKRGAWDGSELKSVGSIRESVVENKNLEDTENENLGDSHLWSSMMKMTKLTIAEVNAKIEKHEAVCAERWLEVLHRVTRLEQFILITLITLVLSMASIIFNIYTGD